MKNEKVTMLEKTVGCISDGRSLSTAIVTMRFTTDKIGETLSLECMGQQITVSYEDVLKLVKTTREKYKK